MSVIAALGNQSGDTVARKRFYLNPFCENHTDMGARADSEYVFTDAA
jgi:hypothetical protein